MPEKKSDKGNKGGLISRLREPKGEKAPPIKGFDRVLVSVDFSNASRLAIILAQSLINPNGIIYTIHITPDITASTKNYLKDSATKDLQKRMGEEALKILSGWVKKCINSSVKIEHVVGAGDPSNEIIKTAGSKRVQVIVMGIHGQKRSDLGIMGSTVDKVIRCSDCPVICVPPERV